MSSIKRGHKVDRNMTDTQGIFVFDHELLFEEIKDCSLRFSLINCKLLYEFLPVQPAPPGPVHVSTPVVSVHPAGHCLFLVRCPKRQELLQSPQLLHGRQLKHAEIS